jgi:uncharacterized protein involved in exopolysaccharide biosynthesis
MDKSQQPLVISDIVTTTVVRCLKNWKLILIGTLVPTIIVAGITLLIPDSFVSTTTIILAQQNQSKTSALSNLSSLGSSDGLASLMGMGGAADLYTLKTLSESRSLGKAAIDQFNLSKSWKLDTDATIEDKLNVWKSKFSFELTDEDAIILSFRHKSPDTVAKVTAFCEGWLDSSFKQIKRAQTTAALTHLTGRMKDQLKRLTSAEDSLVAFQNANRSYIPSEQFILSERRANDIESQISSIDIQIAQANNALGVGNSEANSLQSLKQTLKGKLKEFKSDGSGENQDHLIPLSLSKNLSLNLKFERLRRDMEQCGYVYKVLVEQVELLQLESSKNGSTFTVIDAASVPHKHNAPRRRLIVQAFFGLFFVLSVTISVFKSIFTEMYLTIIAQLKNNTSQG